MLLAIDTSTRYGGLALWSGDRVLVTFCWYSTYNHTAELMPAIEHVMDKANISPSELEAISVALGPGGFSALRVGIGTAKGLALPLNIPLVGLGTLEMEAYPYAGMGLPVCAVLDSGRSEVATATFQESGGHWRKLREERVCTPEELVESISEPTIFCGEGVPHRVEQLQRVLGRNGVVVGFHTPASRLWALGVLAGTRLKMGDVDSLASLQPLYLRSPSIGLLKVPRTVRQ